MNLSEYYSRPNSIGWDELNDKDALVSSYHEDRVQSQVVDLENLKGFLNRHHEYAHNYDYYMSEDTFDLLCQSKGVKMNSIVAPSELQMDGLHIVPRLNFLKIGEILAIPRHDYEHFEPMIYG